MLVVNNSKNPAYDAKSGAKHYKVGEEAGSCCNHSKKPGKGVGGVAMPCCIFDVLSLGCRVASVGPFFCWAPLRGVLVAPARGSVPSEGWGGLLQLQQRAPPQVFPLRVKFVVRVMVPGAW